jgi:hypothetical protein
MKVVDMLVVAFACLAVASRFCTLADAQSFPEVCHIEK